MNEKRVNKKIFKEELKIEQIIDKDDPFLNMELEE